MQRTLSIVLLAPLVACQPPGSAGGDASRYHVTPWPASLSPRTGEFRFTAATRIITHEGDAGTQAIAELFAQAFRLASGHAIPVETADPVDAPGPAIVLRIEPPMPAGEPAALAARTAAAWDFASGEAERYQLDVTPDRIEVVAPSHAGLFRAMQTLRQLLPSAFESAWQAVNGGTTSGDDVAVSTTRARDVRFALTVPAVRIDDAPRFRYRGMHLDVGRHFFPVAFVKKYIDLLAAYRMNVFHWHLTEDQGWRIEIHKYPRLTEVGSRRSETILERNFDPFIGDGIPYGGYYTQDEIREIVAYAAERYVTIVPEIEMPGHSVAALAAYPELACTPGPFEVSTRWGVTEDIFCPSGRTFEFLQDVLTEVMELFPGRYIHIGGDEAPKRAWQESRLAQDVMRREGLRDENELQSWFIRRIERFLDANGRLLIGWDEILEGGLAPGATVMSWRGMDGGIEAARAGHDVIMTPTSHVYFDYYQGDAAQEPLAIGGFTPLETVLAFEPVPPGLNAAQARHVLGAQGNVWTEYMKTPEHVEYMMLPRMLALSEVVWTPRERRDEADFMRRLGVQLDRLDARGANWRVPDVTGLERDRLTLDRTIRLVLGTAVNGATIRFTTDGTEPGPESQAYIRPLALPVADGGITVTARAFLPDGRTSMTRRARFAHTTLRTALGVPDAERAAGLRVDYVEGNFSRTDSLRAATATRSTITTTIGFDGSERPERFGLRFRGMFHATADGIHTFDLTSDDGSRVRIGDALVVDHDGLHGASIMSGQIALQSGWHDFELDYFQAGGGRALGLLVTPPDSAVARPIRADAVAHRVSR